MRNITYLVLFVSILFFKKAYAQSGYGNSHRIVKDSNLILPPSWAFGVLYGGYTDQRETIDRVKEIKQHDYPIDAYWIDSWFWSYSDKGIGPKKYIDFIADTTSYPDRKAMWSFLQQNGVKGGFWIWDCILKNGNEKAFNEFRENGFFSSTFFNTNSWHNGSTSTAMFQDGKERKGSECGNINFDDPSAVNFFKQKMKHFFEEGADFIKLDRTSKISVCKTMFEMSQEFGGETKGRGFLLSHTGGMETDDYKRYPAKWTDDTRSDWTIEKSTIEFNSWVPKIALKENIAMYTDTTKLASRIPFLTNDMGGFDMGKTDIPEEELYIRWLQFSMFCPITEVFSQPENPTSNLAWKYSERADSICRFYAHFRMQLFPYIYTYAHLSRINGEPMIRKIPGQLYEFMLGDEMLVAPVYEKRGTSRVVYLPEGDWVDYWTSDVYHGPSSHFVNAPLYQIPLFVKQGSIIPMRNYASSVEKGNNNTLNLHIYSGNSNQFELIEDDGLSNDYLRGRYASTTIESAGNKKMFIVKIKPVDGDYEKMERKRKWILEINNSSGPAKVSLNSRKCYFNYDPEKRILKIETRRISIKKILEFVIIYSK